VQGRLLGQGQGRRGGYLVVAEGGVAVVFLRRVGEPLLGEGLLQELVLVRRVLMNHAFEVRQILRVNPCGVIVF